MSTFTEGPRVGRRTRGLITTAAALTAAAAFAAPAGAAVTGGIIAALPDSSGLELTYKPNTTLNVTVARGPVTLSTATTTTDSSGAAAINGGGADCWTGATPDMLPGDVVTVTGSGVNDSMVIQDITSERPVQTALDTVVVHGTAPGRPPVSQLRGLIIGNSVFSSGRRQLRAGVGEPYALNYNDLTGDAWTATFDGLAPGDVDLAMNAKDARGTNTLPTLTELTIAQNPVTRGPLAPCSAPLAENSVTSSTPSAVNIANSGAGLVLSGVSQDASSVSVSLDDQNAATAPVTATATPSPATGPQTWTVTVPAASVRGLSDGTLTATPTMTGLATLAGRSMKIVKDTVAPPAPTAGPGPATYGRPQSVTLADGDGTASIRWTNDGSAPTATSTAFTSAINVTATQTIRALAVDKAGNTGPVASFDYTITPPVAVDISGAPPATGAPGATGAAAARLVAAPGARPAPLLIPGLPSGSLANASPATVTGLSVARVSVATLRRSGLRISMRLPAGSHAVSLRIYRARGGRPSGRPLVSTVRAVTAAGRYTVTIRGTAVRRLRAGNYVLQVRSGRSRTALAGLVSRSFRIG
ncbi:MAG: hypothetical protein QOD44_3993 [Solirubrobacteraceae bacterium]|nr:hypothetical protein [Solirubrobacteraceae bacterium]